MAKLTITLTGRPPVSIDKDLWPIVASSSDHDGKIECQANRKWWCKVRRHQDGRSLVYGSYSTNLEKEADKRAGELVAAGGDVCLAIKRVCDALGVPDMAQWVIQDLPAVALA